MIRIGAVLVALLLPLVGCSDDSASDASPGEQILDATPGEAGQVGIQPFSPPTVVLAENMLHDLYVKLTGPAPQELYVDVESNDPSSVSVSTSILKFPKWADSQMTVIQGLKVTTQDVEVVCTLRDTSITQTLKVQVVKELPDAGPPSDT